MISIEYKFNGVELSTLTEAEKVEARKEVVFKDLDINAYLDIVKLLKPEKKIDVASEHIITEIAKLLHDGDEVNVTFVRETLKDVYGDE